MKAIETSENIGGLPHILNNMKTVEQRLLNRTVKDPKTGCWNCTYSTNKGYPNIWVERTNKLAHRVAYELWKGPIPQGLLVCHSCDNPKCINPDHLWVGTVQENNADRDNKGRQAKPEILSAIMKKVAKRGSESWSFNNKHRLARGERNARYTHPETTARGERQAKAKLTAERVRYIRMWAEEGFSHKQIAKAFGVARPTVSQVIRRETWKHVI